MIAGLVVVGWQVRRGGSEGGSGTNVGDGDDEPYGQGGDVGGKQASEGEATGGVGVVTAWVGG